MRTHAEWNVDTHIFWATGPTSAATRCFISSAALLVKVMARISNGRHAQVADEVGDAVGEHPGLARARPGHHEQGPVRVRDRVGLHGVEPVEQAGAPVGARRSVGGTVGTDLGVGNVGHVVTGAGV